ncbi:MAG: alpha/beta hydrolase [Dermatophilus congolensis]|nr:alpha/beta hydrolase [Dermatophilus congolensis]
MPRSADRPNRRKALVRGAAVGVLAILAGIGVMFVFMGGPSGIERSFIFFPDPTDPGSASDWSPGGRDVVLHTDDGLALEAWLLSPTSGDRGVAVLYAPGNGGNRAGRTPLHHELTARGFTVLALDYRGYGGNPGRPSEKGLASDARAAVTLLRAEGFDAEHTIYLGESLGTGVVTGLAVTDPPAGIALRSPFTSIPDAASLLYPWLPVQSLMRERFDVSMRITKSGAKVTVIQGDADDIVPAELSTKVAQAARDAGVLHELLNFPGAGHNDPIMFGPQVAEAVARLADAVT